MKIVKEKLAEFLYGIFLWATKESTPTMLRLNESSPPPAGRYCKEHVGVACALCSTSAHVNVAKKVIHSCMIKQRSKKSSQLFFSTSSSSNSSSSSSYPWNTSIGGDILGTESGIHLWSGQEISRWADDVVLKPYVPPQSLFGRVHVAKKRDIPPPISILRKERGRNYVERTPAGGDDSGGNENYHERLGRVLLAAPEGEGEYLESIRENGRLILNLVTIYP